MKQKVLTRDIIVRRDHAQVKRRNVHLVLCNNRSTLGKAKRITKENKHTDCNTFRINEIAQRVFHKLRKMIREVLMTDIMQVIIIRILRHTSVEVRPCQDILF